MEVRQLIALNYPNYANLKEFELSHMDEFIDCLLREERMCDVILPRLTKREVIWR